MNVCGCVYVCAIGKGECVGVEYTREDVGGSSGCECMLHYARGHFSGNGMRAQC